MAKDFIDLKSKLAKQILQKLPRELSQDKTEKTLYRLSYGCFEISGYKGNLLIEFDEKEPGYGIYYGFMITQDGIDAPKASKIDTIFTPIRQYLELILNKDDNLPPELKRKGRFDEIFCVNLPDKEERKAIFKIHLEKKKKSLDDASLNSICQITDGFNGADIESVVNEAVEECFLSGGKELSKNVLEDIARQTISISKSCRQQIDNMKKAFKENNFKDATTGDTTT